MSTELHDIVHAWNPAWDIFGAHLVKWHECRIAQNRVSVVPLMAGVNMAYVKDADLSDIDTSVEITDAAIGSRDSAYIDMLARMGVV